MPRHAAVGRAAGTSRRNWWNAADRVFAPGHLYLGERDETMDRIYQARGILGFAIVLAAGLRYEGIRAVRSVFEDWGNSLVAISLFAAVAAIVAGAALVAATHPGDGARRPGSSGGHSSPSRPLSAAFFWCSGCRRR